MTKTEIPALSPGDPGFGGTEDETGVVPGGDASVRVLVVFEDRYRAYRETIAAVIRELRPGVEVAVAGHDSLREQVARVSPHLVISSRPKAADPARTPAWIELPHEPGLAAKICFAGWHREAYDVGLKELLAAVDRAGSLVRK
jgi:hypothetical protein